MRYIVSIVLILAATSLAFGQVTDDDDDVINVDSSIVRLNVGVVNRTGRPINFLDKRNFKIFEDGVEQEIVTFEPTETPFSLVLLLDMSGSTRSFRQTIRFSASRFVDALAPEDRVSVIEFNEKANVLNDFTSDREKILHSISVAEGKKVNTGLYSAIELSLKRLAREGSRRKAIVVLTDGVDTVARNLDRDKLKELEETEMVGSISPDTNQVLNTILGRAVLQGVTIYPLALPSGDPKFLPDPTPMQIEMYSAARKRLDLIATRTGGELNAINRLEEMGKLYAQVAASVRSLYTIEYQPTNTQKDGKWREIVIKTDQPDLITKSKPGYFAK